MLIHVCGDESLTLYEVELLMQSLTKHIPSDSKVLFGVATDPSIDGDLSVTLISAVPEEKIHSNVSNEDNEHETPLDDQISASLAAVESSRVMEAPEDEEIMEPSEGFSPEGEEDTPEVVVESDQDDRASDDEGSYADFINMDDVQELADAVLKDAELEMDAESAEETSASDDEAVEQPFAEIEEVDFDEEDDEQDTADEDLQGDFDQEDSLFADTSMSDKQGAQGELELDGGPKGKFEGESPNVLEGEDLDIPPFLRNKKK